MTAAATTPTWVETSELMEEVVSKFGGVNPALDAATDAILGLAESGDPPTLSNVGEVARFIQFVEIDLAALSDWLEQIREAQRELILRSADA